MRRACLRVALAICSASLSACSAERSADASLGLRTPATFDTVAPPVADTPPWTEPSTPDSLLGLVIAPDSLLDALETLEYGYEERALTVYAIRDSWYRVGTRDGADNAARRWLRASDVGVFMPLDSLVLDRLNYLTEAWDGALRVAPGSDAAQVRLSSPIRALAPDADRTPARVLRTQRAADTWWAQIEVLSTSGCEDETPRVLATGWVPLWGINSARTVWFFSRGC